jgi:enoyl-[acyl-carrier protein] reductase I
MGFLKNKRALIVGVASKRSIAWGIAKAMHEQGATLAFTYQNERLQERVEKLAAELGSQICLPCDVSSDEEIAAVFNALAGHWTDGLDIIVHAVAYAPREGLTGDYLEAVDREAYKIAHDISAYSFSALAKAGRKMLRPGAALLTLSYLGAVRVIPHYNVMGMAKASLEANVRYMAVAMGPEGMRVNAISAGPVKTLAAAGISDFRKLLDYFEANAPLRRAVGIDEIGNAAAFLCSDLASAITGEVLYVDGGFNVTSMAAEG